MKPFLCTLLFISCGAMDDVPQIRDIKRARHARFIFSSEEVRAHLALFRAQRDTSGEYQEAASKPTGTPDEISKKQFIARDILYSS